MHLIEKHEGKIVSSQYTEETEQDVSIRISRVEAFQRELVEATAGKAHIVQGAND
jgi:exosome complex RNA-binding protein Csl4